MRFQGSQVDAGGPFGGMPHALADDRERDALVSGNACPGVSRHIHGERQGETDASSEVFQMPVDQGQGVVALPGNVLCRFPDDGEQVGRIVGRGVSDGNPLHARFPAHGQGLSGFSASVGENPVFQVFFLQKCDIHE